VVPTMVIIRVLVEHGRRLGLSLEGQDKAQYIFRHALEGLEAMRKAGVMIGFGTDLLGETYTQQCREFTIRREVFSPIEILRQATSTNARLLQQEHKLGCIKAGAHADLLVIDGDPLSDIALLSGSGKHLRLIMHAGELVRNTLV
jgi:imidazolonepropionase-like amidohydrolase